MAAVIPDSDSPGQSQFGYFDRFSVDVDDTLIVFPMGNLRNLDQTWFIAWQVVCGTGVTCDISTLFRPFIEDGTKNIDDDDYQDHDVHASIAAAGAAGYVQDAPIGAVRFEPGGTSGQAVIEVYCPVPFGADDGVADS